MNGAPAPTIATSCADGYLRVYHSSYLHRLLLLGQRYSGGTSDETTACTAIACRETYKISDNMNIICQDVLKHGTCVGNNSLSKKYSDVHRKYFRITHDGF